MDLLLVCSECDCELDAEVDRRKKVMIERCDCCDTEMKEESNQEGYEIGHDDGWDAGYQRGEESNEKIIGKYKRYLDRLGIDFEPD